MIFLDILMAVSGSILALFLPGYLLARILLRKLGGMEKIVLGFMLSIVLDISIGFLLGYNKATKDIIGGLNALSIWIALVLVTIGLFVLWIFRNKDESRRVWRKIARRH